MGEAPSYVQPFSQGFWFLKSWLPRPSPALTALPGPHSPRLGNASKVKAAYGVLTQLSEVSFSGPLKSYLP